MKKLHLSFVFLAFVLVFTRLAPATAFAKSDAQNGTAATSNSILTISNKSIGPVTVTLTGPSPYTIVAPIGVATQEIIKGTYKISYKACGLSFSGILKATGAKSKIPIGACKTSNIIILNFTDSTITINLAGPATYFYSIPPHSSVRAKILRGVYQYSGVCHGKTSSGTWTITSARFLIWCR